MTIPFLDIRAAYIELKEEIDAAISDVLNEGWYIGGQRVAQFEQDFAAYTEANHCVGVGNGLDALSLALEALDIGPDDEVLVPSNTFIATWLAVSRRGARIVPIEPDPDTMNIDPDRLRRALTNKTRAVIPVHLFGQPADMHPILEFAGQFGLKVIEDAAQAHGARYRGRRIGAHSDAVVWSFYPSKNLGAIGDGGAVTTDDERVAQRVRLLSNYGSSVKYEHRLAGVNSRLDPLQAAVLSVKLSRLDEWNHRRERLASLYRDELAGMGIAMPRQIPAAESVWHVFVISTPHRAQLQNELTSKGVQTIIHYPTPPHLQGAYKNLGFDSGSFPIAETLAGSCLSLPIGPHLSVESVHGVCRIISSWQKNIGRDRN